MLQEDGTYQVAGVPVGPARVTVGSFNDLLPPFVPPKGPKAVVLPRAYADAAKSGLTVEVRQGH